MTLRIVVSFLLIVFASNNAFAECTLQRPGPFLNPSKGQNYKKKLSEDSSNESLTLSTNKLIRVDTYGCEDNWGWTIKVESKSEQTHTLEDGLKELQSALSHFLPKKLADYSIAEQIKSFSDKIASTKLKKTDLNQKEMVCARMGTLSPKECARTLPLELKTEKGRQVVSFDFQDLEN
jgi:hypothetical protein